MINIQISNSLQASQIPLDDITETIQTTAQAVLNRLMAHDNEEVSIILTEDEQIHELNKQFLAVDAPTDVLSFTNGETDPDSGAYYLGDVIISYDRAARQALTGGHSVNAELQLLVVHGLLHLYHYDHQEVKNRAKMWEIQSELLRQLNCPIDGPKLEAES